MKKENQFLVVYWKQLGDLLLMEPTLAKLALVSGSNVLVSTRPEFTPLLSLMDNVSIAPSLKPIKATSVFSFDHRFRSGLRVLLTKSRNKNLILPSVKYRRYWHQFIFNSIDIYDPSHKYRAEYFFDAINKDSGMKFRLPKLNSPPSSWIPKGLPNRYVLLHTTSAWKNKSWAIQSWVKTIDTLKDKGIESFVVTGGAAQWEVDYVQSIIDQSKARIINFCGQTNIQQYLSIVHQASMVITVDGSASHIASAFNRPALTLFGPTHPLHWHSPTNRSVAVDARRFSSERKPSATLIPAEFVIKEAIYLWNSIKP